MHHSCLLRFPEYYWQSCISIHGRNVLHSLESSVYIRSSVLPATSTFKQYDIQSPMELLYLLWLWYVGWRQCGCIPKKNCCHSIIIYIGCKIVILRPLGPYGIYCLRPQYIPCSTSLCHGHCITIIQVSVLHTDLKMASRAQARPKQAMHVTSNGKQYCS